MGAMTGMGSRRRVHPPRRVHVYVCMCVCVCVCAAPPYAWLPSVSRAVEQPSRKNHMRLKYCQAAVKHRVGVRERVVGLKEERMCGSEGGRGERPSEAAATEVCSRGSPVSTAPAQLAAGGAIAE